MGILIEEIRVVITDDHEVFRQGIVSILSEAEAVNVCGQAEDGQEAIRLSRELLPDIILMDINLPVVDGIAATRAIATRTPSVKVIILSVSADDEHLFEAIRAGAQGYLIKTASPTQIVDAIRAISDGGVVVSPELAASLVAEFKDLEDRIEPEKRGRYPGGLSSRETEVLQLLSQGLSNKEIAERLYISERTVKNHISNVLSKLHLENRVKAAIYAVREGIAE